MAHQTNKANNKPDGSYDDKYLLPSIRYNQQVTRKVSQESQASQNHDATARGGPAQNIAGTANPNLGSISVGSQIPVVNHPGAARSCSNPWTAGFERAMQDVSEAGRASLPLPIGHGRPTGRPVSASNQRTTVMSGNSSSRLDAAAIREVIENAVEQQVADALAPLRLIVSNLTDAVRATAQEKADLQEQNDIFGRQLDLQYHEIQQNSSNANAHVRSLVGLVETLARNSQNVADNMAHNNQSVAENMIRNNQTVVENMTRNNQAVAEHLAAMDGLVRQLSLIVSHLPIAVGQAVHSETRLALGEIINAQQRSFDQIKDFFSHQYTQLEHYCIAVTQHLGSLRNQHDYGDIGTGAPVAPFQDDNKQQNEEQRDSCDQDALYEPSFGVESFEPKGQCEVVSDRGAAQAGCKVKTFFKKLIKLGRKSEQGHRG